jgi:hypothetical protein
MPTPRQSLEALYEEGTRQLLGGQAGRALDCFKEIYMVDHRFRDVARIVEDSYTETDWAAKHRQRIQERDGS